MSDATGRVDGAVQRLGELLEQSGRTVGVAESLTGGLLVQALARHEGSGEWLAGGVVAYRRSVKHDLLAVSVDKVVSEQAAAEMATSVRERLGCDVGVAVTGVAGPDWQDGERPGTVWVAVDVGPEPVTELIRIHSGSPEEICQRTVIEAIMLATRELDSAPGVDLSSIDPHAPDVDRGRRGGRGGARFVRDNALSLGCFGLFAAFWFAQSVTGWRSAVADAVEHGAGAFGYWHYLTTAHFAEATFENWESEFLQMGAFVLLTIFLIQKGSSESKQQHGDPRDADPRAHQNDPDAPWPVRRGGLWLVAYENSLLVAFTVMFAVSFIGHAVSGAHEYTAEQHEHGALGVGVWQFVRMSEFWFQSFQNWQSEFLAVGSIVVLSVFLRRARLGRVETRSRPTQFHRRLIHRSTTALGSHAHRSRDRCCVKITAGMDRLQIDGTERGWAIAGEIDAANCEKLATAMAELPEVTAGPIEVDFAGVTFMDSSGLRVFVNLHQRVTAAGGTVVITNPPQGVVRLLTLTDLASQFGVSDDDVRPQPDRGVASDTD